VQTEMRDAEREGEVVVEKEMKKRKREGRRE
jgi:hypothetical protein